MADLILWPFPLPDRFLDALGYARVVEAFESPAMRAHIADLLCRQGIAEPQPMPTGPRRFVALSWEPAGDELAFTDGVHSGAGQLNHWLWLDYLHGRAPVCRRRCSVPSAPGCWSTRSTWAQAIPPPA